MSVREPQTFVVFGFETTHDAMAAEWLLKANAIAVVPIPAPKSLGDLCGLAMRVPPCDESRAQALLRAGGLVPRARVEIEDV